MYIKPIYDSWQLHPDATQLEINYKFLTLFVDISDTKTLTPVSGELENVTNPQVVADWKQWRYEQLYKDFRQISTTQWPENELFNHDSFLIRCLFIIPFILNAMKTTNYKASELEVYYEPRIFNLACVSLELAILEEWVSLLYLRLTNLEPITNPPALQHECDWKITYDAKHFKNTVWFMDNLSLTFADIFSWFETQIPHLKDNETKTSVINIMNHFIVYALTDFYLKYYIEINKVAFQKTHYNYFLSCVNLAINDHSFAFLSYQAIASFLGLLLSNKLIKENDTLIMNFNKISSISSSPKNKEKFTDLIFKTQYPPLSAPNPTQPLKVEAQKTTPFEQIFTTELPSVKEDAADVIEKNSDEESIDDFLEDLIK